MEPCENRGTRVAPMDPIALMRQRAGSSATGKERLQLTEVHIDPAARELVMRPHYPRRRCRRARAGDPEPLPTPGNDLDG